MKQIILLLLVTVSIQTTYAQELKAKKQNGKYGYFDSTGKVVIPFKYDSAWSFENGIGAVCLSHKWGFVNAVGTEVIPLTYDELVSANFYDGLLGVRKGSKWGFIDTTAKLVIDYKYDDVKLFSSGRCVVKLNNKWGIIDTKGTLLAPCKYSYLESFTEPVVMMSYNSSPEGVGGKWGAIDINGKEVAAPKYDEVGFFRQGFSKVRLNKKWGLIDEKGVERLAVKYDLIDDFFDYKAARINTGGRELDNGYGEYEFGGGKWGFINNEGKITIPPKYDEASERTDSGCYIVAIKSNAAMLYGIVSGEGVEVVPAVYSHMESSSEGLIRAAKGGKADTEGVLQGAKWGFFNSQGKLVVPLDYESLGVPSEGLICASKNGKYGYIDYSGNEVIPFIYEYSLNSVFMDGVAEVTLNGKTFEINKKGQRVK